MELGQALRNIQRFNSTFAKDELLCIREHKEESIPALLDFLAQAIDTHRITIEWREDLDYTLYAMHLLAEFGVHDAFPLFAEILELDKKKCDWMLGDTLTEGMGALIASVATKDDIDRIKAIAENTDLYVFQRTAAITALIVLYSIGIYPRADLIIWLGHLLDADSFDGEFIDCLVSYCYEIAAVELYECIRALYKEHKVLEFFIGAQDFAEDAPLKSEEEVLESLQKRSQYRIVKDTVAEMGWWYCFNRDKGNSVGVSKKPRDMIGSEKSPKKSRGNVSRSSVNTRNEPSKTIVKPPKIGRNAPCPCGSGKKYKHCCLMSS